MPPQPQSGLEIHFHCDGSRIANVKKKLKHYTERKMAKTRRTIPSRLYKTPVCTRSVSY